MGRERLKQKQYMLNQQHAKADKMRRQVGVDVGRPALVGINDDVSFGSAATDCFESGHIVGRAEFDFQKRTVRVPRRRLFHVLRRIKR